MFLALRELRRNIVRFGMLAAAVALLVFLVLFQQALQTGLITAFVGAIENQTAPVIVYNVEGQRTLQASVITPPAEEAVATVDGIDGVARLAQRTFTIIDAAGDEETAAIVGVDNAAVSQPTTLTAGREAGAPGEAVGSSADFEVGDEVSVPAPAGGEPVTLTVVGVADGIQLSVSPTLFTDFDTYAAAVRATNPDAEEILPGALALRPAADVTAAELATRVNAADADLDAVTREVAAETAPGVSQVRQSFRVILTLFGLVVPLVTGLFFLIITLQKSRSLTLLRAIGAPAGLLARALLVQVLAVTATGLLLGTTLYWLVARGKVGGLTVRYDPSAVITWTIAFIVLAALGALVSLRRVLRIDPFEAVAGGGGR